MIGRLSVRIGVVWHSQTLGFDRVPAPWWICLSLDPVDILSGVPQGTVFGPLLFLVYINDITDYVSSSCRLFADDCILYRQINSPTDAAILQNDLKELENWDEIQYRKMHDINSYLEKTPITL